MHIQIQKRNGFLQPLEISKIVYRIDRLIKAFDDTGEKFGRELDIDANCIALEVCQHVKDKIKSAEIDDITARICGDKVLENPDYNELATRLVISDNHKSNRDWLEFTEITQLLNEKNPGRFSPIYLGLVEKYGNQLDREICYSRDYLTFDYFGYKTLEKNYLISTIAQNHVVRERPQHLWMRVALEIHRHDIPRVIEMYHDLSQFYYNHATPTLYNSGHIQNQLGSCFLVAGNDSIEGMHENARRLAHISKHSGGIGYWLTNIRGNNAVINSTGGRGSGLVPYIKTLNSICKHVDQGGKRKGSIACFLETFHPDLLAFLDLKKNTGDEEFRARDIFPALFINDIFMERLEKAITLKKSQPTPTPTLSTNEKKLSDAMGLSNSPQSDEALPQSKGVMGEGVLPQVLWSFMCPKACPGLVKAYGAEFTKLYEEYERAGKFVKQVDILEIWSAMLDSQIETGTPYMIYKDAANRLSNQQNIGTINSSNLCVEILEVSTYDEIASCNLASISLAKYVNKDKPFGYDLELLATYAGRVCRNLNNVIDRGFYPLPQIKRGNYRHRPIGIGVQGLADVFYQLRMPYESAEAMQLNRLIMEAIYYGAVRETIVLARERTEMMASLAHLSLDARRELVHMIGKHELYLQNLADFNRVHTEDVPTSAVEQEYRDEMQLRIAELLTKLTNVLTEANIDMERFNWVELQYWNPDRPQQLWGAYSSFDGSPASQGKFHFDLSGDSDSATHFDWDSLKRETALYGWRNSLLVALMPTASTAQIMGNTECFEQPTNNIYARTVLSGQFMVVNKYLQRDLMKLGLWNREMTEEIMRERGSVQNISKIPKELRDLYKTGWEISKRVYLKMARDRQIFIDQSQSLNLHIPEPTYDLLTTIHLYGWRLGLKTGMYYLRRQTVAKAQQFTVDASKSRKTIDEKQNQKNDTSSCRLDDGECTMCSA